MSERERSEPRLARRVGSMGASAVREILKVASRPDILSFAGGLPAPELFPVEAVAEAHARVLADEGRTALQYSITEGDPLLRDWIAQRLASRGIRVTAEQVIITNGSQQGIDLLGKVLLNAGDAVAIENPSYLAAIQSFAVFEADLQVVDSDAGGVLVDQTADVLRSGRPKLLYLVPEFHNPTGATLAADRRAALVELARATETMIIEDDPYGELRFAGQAAAPLASRDGGQGVVYLGTFSKTLVPGMRLGYLAAPTALVTPLTIAKQAADLHTATLAQRVIARLLETFDYDAHLNQLRAAYRSRYLAMQAGLESQFPAGTTWNAPAGGLFLWVRLPAGYNADELFPRALEEHVAFVPGSAFFAARPDPRCLRLNFSNRPAADITIGMTRLGRALGRSGDSRS